jgi:pimeloyl-ACP methyl ester carboxylesterase
MPLVIAVHGLYSKSDRVERLLELPRKAGLPCGEYSYSSRRPIPELAVQFAEELDRVRREHPDRKVAVIAHSMGGLVARAAIEDPALDPGNVRRLVMLATPNQGSRLAEFNFALGLSNYVTDSDRRENVRLFSALAEDTLGASSYDLRPGSEFLARLNARPRNEKVAYTVILGSGAWLSADERDRMSLALGESEEEGRFLRLIRGNVNKLLADLDEVVKGEGDGAVSIERGKLAGVDDVIVLPFGHSEIIGRSTSEAVVKAHEEALARILKDADL